MVCVYCGSPTQVKNSRLLVRSNTIWRRRKCTICLSIFTTHEQPGLDGAFMIKAHDGTLQPFNRDRLFIAIYESCRHRPTADSDATALTQIVVSRLLKRKSEGVIPAMDIADATSKTLRHFDSAAATIYAAYHPTSP